MDVNLKDDYRHDQCLINQSRSDFTLPYETGTGCQGQRLAHFNPSRLSPSRDRTFVRYGPSVIKLTFSIGNMLSILFFSFFLVLNTYKVDRQNLFYFISCFFFSPLLCSLLFIFFSFLHTRGETAFLRIRNCFSFCPLRADSSPPRRRAAAPKSSLHFVACSVVCLSRLLRVACTTPLSHW